MLLQDCSESSSHEGLVYLLNVTFHALHATDELILFLVYRKWKVSKVFSAKGNKTERWDNEAWSDTGRSWELSFDTNITRTVVCRLINWSNCKCYQSSWPSRSVLKICLEQRKTDDNMPLPESAVVKFWLHDKINKVLPSYSSSGLLSV